MAELQDGFACCETARSAIQAMLHDSYVAKTSNLSRIVLETVKPNGFSMRYFE